MKKSCWMEITEKLNASLTVKRTSDEVEKKWHNIFSSAKTELSNFKRETVATGGGPNKAKPLSATAETIQQIIGEDNEIISGIQGESLDSSVLQLGEESLCSVHLDEDGTTCVQPVQQSFSPIVLSPGCHTITLPIQPTLSHKRSSKEVIEELTIKKLRAEIQLYELKIKKVRRELEE